MSNTVPVILTLVLVVLVCATPAAAIEAPRTGTASVEDVPTWVPREVIVGLGDTPVAATLDRIREMVPAVARWRSLCYCPSAHQPQQARHPLSCVRVVELASGANVPMTAARISRMPGIAYAHPNYIIKPAYLPDDEFFQSHQYAPNIVRAPEAWELTTGRSQVVIAIIDSGVRFDHEDFQPDAFWANNDPVNGIDDDHNGFIDDYRGWDFINADNQPIDDSGHGTHVAGIAAARIDNAVGIAGMANATVMPLKVFHGGYGSWVALAEAITYAVDNGAKVINFSGGGSGGAGLLAEAVAYAWENGVPVITAAGNHGSTMPYYPAGYPETIAVAVTGHYDAYASFSGRGSHIDVAAPGVDIWSTYSLNSSAYTFATGTSMSAPHVTGLVALIYSLNPHLDIEQVRSLLHQNALDLGNPGFDIYYGWGRIDAAATLQAVPADATPPSILHQVTSRTRPVSGYIDPRDESSDGVSLDRGIDTLVITFTEPVRDLGSGEGGTLTVDAFSVTGTGESYLRIQSITDLDNHDVLINLTGPIPPAEWTTIIARVEDLAGNPIASLGDLGPDMDEPDRVDVGFLPGDVDQSGRVDPFDLLRFRETVLDGPADRQDHQEQFVDINRDGEIGPVDLLHFREIVQGTGNATRRWAGETLPERP